MTHDPQRHDDGVTHPATIDRRDALKRLGRLAAGAAIAVTGIASAHGGGRHGSTARTHGAASHGAHGHDAHGHGAHGHDAHAAHASGGMGATPLGPPPYAGVGRPMAHPIPWQDGTCAFCTMTLATPHEAPQGPGFRERTYAQWAFDGEARHFESIGCALSWAYVHDVVDGEGAALYVSAFDLDRRPTQGDLFAGADATFLWGDGLMTSMRAKWAAFPDHNAATAYATAHDAAIGRRRFAALTLLADLAPLPINNLTTLMARHAGLIG